MNLRSWIAAVMIATQATAGEDQPGVRIATFNASLAFDKPGALVANLRGGGYERARKIAAIIQRVRPDVLLMNEFDYAGDETVNVFVSEYLEVGQFGQAPIRYPYRFVAPVNTGVLSGVDINGDGRVTAPGDAHGFGRFEGQYGMVVLSRLPFGDGIRTFRNFRWTDMPDAWWPREPQAGDHYYSKPAREALRLSSKSHWDLPVLLPDGRSLHLLASHPTPPVFDGPEDRNGRRNHDEIRFWRDYIDGLDYIYDDLGRQGGLTADTSFVIAGDLNADPNDGDSSGNAIGQLLGHPRVNSKVAPSSEGADAAGASGRVNLTHRGDPRNDTSNWTGGETGPGNLRTDYVLPSIDLNVIGSGVFWPLPDQPSSEWIEASDHRLVWIDIALETGAAD